MTSPGSGRPSAPTASERDVGPELGAVLGPSHRLDHSFGSLFAVDEVVEALRIRGGEVEADLKEWLARYLGTFAHEAWKGLGLGPRVEAGTISADGVVVKPGEVVERLLAHPRDPGARFPLSSRGDVPACDPRVGPALTAWWGLGCLLRVHPWGSPAQEASQSQELERAGAVRRWLAREAASRAAAGDADLQTVALRVAEAMVFPPLGHPMDPHGHLGPAWGLLALGTERDAGTRLVRRLLTGPDRFVAACAARAALSLDLAPATEAEAYALVRALEPGRRAHLFGAVREALDRLFPAGAAGDADAARERARTHAARGAHAAAAIALASCCATLEREPVLRLRRAEAAAANEDWVAVRDDLAAVQAALPHLAEVRAASLQCWLAWRAWGKRAAPLTRPPETRQAHLPPPPLERPALPQGGGAPHAAPPDRDLPPAPIGASPQAAPAAASTPPTFRQGGGLAPAESGERLGPYTVLGLLGQGGMGRVLRVRRDGWELDLALKVPRGELDDGLRAGIVHEADAWAGLGLHPFVASCFFVEMHEGVPWIVAELVQGGSLQAFIRGGKLYRQEQPLHTVLTLAWQTAMGMHHAHERGLIHQDLKPANVLLTPEGTAKVTDFGLARVGTREHAGDGKPGTLMAKFAGMTPAYCSPEQAVASKSANAVPITRRSDIYSWAILVLEMFTGRVTWGLGPLAGTALAAVAKASPGELSGKPAMPAPLAELLAKCFSVREHERPSSMLQVADTIEKFGRKSLGLTLRTPVLGSYDGADELYNRGIGLAALGETDRALSLWARALRGDPLHVRAAFAHAVTRWRRGEITDLEAVRRFDDVYQFVSLRAQSGGGARVARADADDLGAWLHAERGAMQATEQRLVAARASRGGQASIVARELERKLPHAGSLKPSHPASRSPAGLAMSGAGSALVFGGVDAGGAQVLERLDQGKAEQVSLGASFDHLAACERCDTVAVACPDVVHVLRYSDRKRWTLRRPAGLLALAMSPDGARVGLLTPSELELHSLHTGDARLLPTAQPASHLALANELAPLAVVERTRVVLLNERGPTPLFEAPGPIAHLAVTRSGGVVVATGTDAASGLDFFSARNEQGAVVTRTFPSEPHLLALAASGAAALTLSKRGLLRRWLVPLGRCVTTTELTLGGEPYLLALSSDGHVLATITHNGELRREPMATLTQGLPLTPVQPTPTSELEARVARIRSHVGKLRELQIARKLDEARDELAKLRADPSLHRANEVRNAWTELSARSARARLSSAARVAELESPRGAVSAVELVPSGGEVLIATRGEPNVRVCEVSTGELRTELRHDAPVTSLAVSLLGGLWVTTAGREVYVRRGGLAKLLGRVELPFAPTGVAVAPGQGRVLAYHDSAIAVLDLGPTPTLVGVLPVEGTVLRRAALGWDVSCAHLATRDGVVALRLTPGARPERLAEHAACDVQRVGIDDEAFLACLDDGRLLVGRGHRAFPLVGPSSDSLTGVATSFDGKFAVTVGSTGEVVAWTTEGHEAEAILSGHGGHVTDVTMTPCGRFAATGGSDGKVNVWSFEWELAAHEASAPPPGLLSALRRARDAGEGMSTLRRMLEWVGRADTSAQELEQMLT
jgi:WD40 repeat protein